MLSIIDISRWDRPDFQERPLASLSQETLEQEASGKRVHEAGTCRLESLLASQVIFAVGSRSRKPVALSELWLCHLSDDEDMEAPPVPGEQGCGILLLVSAGDPAALNAKDTYRAGLTFRSTVLCYTHQPHNLFFLPFIASILPSFSVCASLSPSEFSNKNCVLTAWSKQSNWLQKGTCTMSPGGTLVWM